MMKELSKASVIFHVMDDYFKTPITNAMLKCSDDSAEYIKKNDGYYVFLNLQRRTYNFTITCAGYNDVNYEVELKDNEPVEIRLSMQASMGDISRMNIDKIVFNLYNDGSLVINKDLIIRLDTKVSFLKVIDPISRGSSLIGINYDYNKNLLFQEYYYDKALDTSLFIVSYDWGKNKYKTREPYQFKANPGGYLRPIWRVKTDKNGRVVLPINAFFINEKNAEFTIICDDLEATVSSEISNNAVVDVNLSKKVASNENTATESSDL